MSFMKKYTPFLLSVMLLVSFSPLSSLAVEGTTDTGKNSGQELQEKRKQLREEIKQKQDAFKKDLQQKRDALHSQIKEGQKAFQDEFRAKRDAIKQEFEKKREEFKKEFEARRDALKGEIEKKRDAFRAEEMKRREELQKKVGERRAKNIEMFFKKMILHFEDMVGRLREFSDRIETRLRKAADNGKDVTQDLAKLAAAREKILDAEKALEDAKASYTKAAESPDFRASFAKVKELLSGVKEKIREAHSALVEVVQSIKGLGEGSQGTSTTTATTTNSGSH